MFSKCSVGVVPHVDVFQQDEGINQERGRHKIQEIGAETQESGTGKLQNDS